MSAKEIEPKVRRWKINSSSLKHKIARTCSDTVTFLRTSSVWNLGSFLWMPAELKHKLYEELLPFKYPGKKFMENCLQKSCRSSKQKMSHPFNKIYIIENIKSRYVFIPPTSCTYLGFLSYPPRILGDNTYSIKQLDNWEMLSTRGGECEGVKLHMGIGWNHNEFLVTAKVLTGWR